MKLQTEELQHRYQEVEEAHAQLSEDQSKADLESQLHRLMQEHREMESSANTLVTKW